LIDAVFDAVFATAYERRVNSLPVSRPPLSFTPPPLFVNVITTVSEAFSRRMRWREKGGSADGRIGDRNNESDNIAAGRGAG